MYFQAMSSTKALGDTRLQLTGEVGGVGDINKDFFIYFIFLNSFRHQSKILEYLDLRRNFQFVSAHDFQPLGLEAFI